MPSFSRRSSRRARLSLAEPVGHSGPSATPSTLIPDFFASALRAARRIVGERHCDIEAVMDAAGADRAVLLGFSEGGAMC